MLTEVVSASGPTQVNSVIINHQAKLLHSIQFTLICVQYCADVCHESNSKCVFDFDFFD